MPSTISPAAVAAAVTARPERTLAAAEVDIVGGSALEVLALPAALVEPPYMTAVAGGTIGVWAIRPKILREGAKSRSTLGRTCR